MDFVVYGDRWGELPTSATHLFRHVAAEGHRVIWVNTIGRMPRLSVNDFRKVTRVMRDLVGPGKGSQQDEAAPLKEAAAAENDSEGNATEENATEENVAVSDSTTNRASQPIVVRTAPMVPRFGAISRRVNRRLLTRFHQRLRQQYQLQDEFLVSPFPYVVDLFANVPQRSLYFCYDEWSAYPGVDTKRWVQMENEIIDVVDGFFGTDMRLMEKPRPSCPSLFCPQGVEYEHFAQHGLPVPEALQSISQPVIGFFGLISEWVDTELMIAAARKFPEATILLIGRAIPQAQRQLQLVPNIVMTGQVPYEQLPAYAQVFDIGIIPFKISTLTRAVNPLKLLEYYALGCPVVSTGMQSIAEVGGPALVGDTPDEFNAAIAKWLAEPRDAIARQAREHARANSWTARAEALLEFTAGIPITNNS